LFVTGLQMTAECKSVSNFGDLRGKGILVNLSPQSNDTSSSRISRRAG
jgi:hypothetical protein